MIVYLNGEYVPEERAVVSVFDHGYLYGDGVFEGLRAYSGRVFKLAEHIRRLYESAKTIMLEIPLTPAEMEAVTLETCRRNGISDGYIRIVVSRGKGDLGLDPRKCGRPTVVVIAHKIQLYPAELYEKGLEVVSVATRRSGPEVVNPRVKSLNYLNNILAKIEANHLGYAEVLMLDDRGFVVEGTGDNVFCVRDGGLLTPPTSAGILAGITRQTIIDLAREAGMDVAETLLPRHDVYNSDECFLTGTAAEVIPVVKVDGRTIGDGKPGPVTRRLIEAFRAYANATGTEIYPEAAASVD